MVRKKIQQNVKIFSSNKRLEHLVFNFSFMDWLRSIKGLKMDIKEVKTAIKIGQFQLKKNHKNKIEIIYNKYLGKEVLTDDSPRIYFFVIDGIIKKIGGSQSIGGIKATMSFYVNAMQGSPGPPRYVLHLLIEKKLINKSKVELFMISSKKIIAEVYGLFESKKLEIASFKEMENLCKSDYYKIEKKYPDWNFQENNTDYPKDEYLKYLEHHRKRQSKKH